MNAYYSDAMLTFYHGDVLDTLRQMPDASVQCVVTSPPYWALRDYGQPGQLGLEATPQEYVAKMVAVFDEVRRVLRDDGVVWLNLGDSYVGGGGYAPDAPSSTSSKSGKHGALGALVTGGIKPQGSLKPKDLVGIPWRVAFALQDAGWWLRSDVIWSKPNPMPESVQDRPTKAHEYVFLLTKSARYFYDADAVRTPAKSVTTKMPDGWDTGPGAHGSFHRNGREQGRKTDKQRGHGRRHDGFNDRWDGMSKSEQQAMGANLRSVWTIATQPFPEAHFATFPEQLARTCILAGSAEGDVVLDPFVGSGTTALVAQHLGRKCIGIDLSSDYLDMAIRRTAQKTLWSVEAVPCR